MHASTGELHQRSFISKLHFGVSKGLPHAEPLSNFRVDERELVLGILQMLQGFSSYLFHWDEGRQKFMVKIGIYALHLSKTSLNCFLKKFIFCGTCLKKVELFVKKVEASRQRVPTLKAFANSINSWLKGLRDVALKEEMKSASRGFQMTTTLLELTNSLSSICSGAEHLAEIVHGSIPNDYIDSQTSVPANKIAVFILDYLFKKLNEVCLVHGSEEEAYHMLLVILGESLLPYLEVLDSWLYEGFLDDPYEEVFFYANNAITIDQPTFWETSYLFRPGRRMNSIPNENLVGGDDESTPLVRKKLEGQEPFSQFSISGGRDQTEIECPMFLKELARPIVSAGKSLQLIQHIRDDYYALFDKSHNGHLHDVLTPEMSDDLCGRQKFQLEAEPNILKRHESEAESCRQEDFINRSIFFFQKNRNHLLRVLTLSEHFLVSVAGLVGDGDHIYEKLTMPFPEIAKVCKPFMNKQNAEKEVSENEVTSLNHEKVWVKFLADAISGRINIDMGRESCVPSVPANNVSVEVKENNVDMEFDMKFHNGSSHKPILAFSYHFMEKHKACWGDLNVSKYIHLPPLNDESLRNAIYNEKFSEEDADKNDLSGRPIPELFGTDYTFGFQNNEFKQHQGGDNRTLEKLYSFPTLLPCIQEDVHISDLLPFQKNSTLSLRILCWIQSIGLTSTLHPDVIIKECLAVYIKKQMDQIGKHILSKLMSDWKLMDELNVLRAFFLLGSGDLLQQFLTVIFDKIDKGESWNDDFELNTILQESIRNSADITLLSYPDSFVVSIAKSDTFDDEANKASDPTTPHKTRNQYFGIDALDLLKFSYKVSWPLELIVNVEALKNYNQVMGFLMKVKRAKHVLDKARRWMWKSRSAVQNFKHHLLVQQKLLHFVDAFHQYVMDRVFHSAWIELCTAMASAGSLDEVIEVHEAYLLSIQRQCFVGPDKLWSLIASRVKSILGLALDFYTTQQTLHSGGAAPAIKARCEMEVDHVEKQFDDCIAFLLRILSFKLNVGHFPHLADLVTRINYNYFYMSDSGILITVASFEAGKLGRSLPSKSE